MGSIVRRDGHQLGGESGRTFGQLSQWQISESFFCLGSEARRNPLRSRFCAPTECKRSWKTRTEVWKRATGHKLLITFATGGATVTRAGGGEAALTLSSLPTEDRRLGEKDSKVAANAVTAIASTGISVAVRKAP